MKITREEFLEHFDEIYDYLINLGKSLDAGIIHTLYYEKQQRSLYDSMITRNMCQFWSEGSDGKGGIIGLDLNNKNKILIHTISFCYIPDKIILPIMNKAKLKKFLNNNI